MKSASLFNQEKIRTIYGRRAKRYDTTTKVYPLLGAPIEKWRALAIETLQLQEGDTVADIGCGTGLNLPLLEDRIGPSGSILAIDLTPEMLGQAKKRVENSAWKNVEFIQSDASQVQLPKGLGGAVTSYALTLMPEYEKVIQNVAAALAPGRRLVVLDFKLAQGPISLLTPLLERILVRPYAGTVEMARQRRPWEAIERHMTLESMTEFYGGFVYIAVGQSKEKSQRS